MCIYLLRQIDTLNSLRQYDTMIFFLYVFFWLSYSYKLFIYMRNFILHILTKVKFYTYIYTLIFEFVFTILIFRALATPVNALQMLKLC